MEFNVKRAIYSAVPLPLKRLVRLVPFSWWAGPAYRRTMARLGAFDRASRAEIEAYQERELGAMLDFATDQVPAYRPLRAAVERHRPFDALREFPFLDKETVLAGIERYLPRDFAMIPHYEISTGGTSGRQMTFFVDDVSQSVETAFVHRLWTRVGHRPGSRKATFRGVPFPNLPPDVYWQENPIFNELQYSPYHMTEDTLPFYVERMILDASPYLYGYPSAIDYVAGYILRHRLEESLPEIHAAFLISEACSEEQRARIEAAFRTRVFSFYGHSERLILAGECERTTVYHHFPDYGVLEIVAEDGSPCDEPGDRGELVGTGLLNRSMPLIRYRTGDWATRREHACECGRCWDRFSDVLGRWRQEFVIGAGGEEISVAAMNVHGSVFENVARYQYHQSEPGALVVRVVPTPAFTDGDRARIESAYAEKAGRALLIEVAVVDEIPLTARGKLKLLDSILEAPSEGPERPLSGDSRDG